MKLIVSLKVIAYVGTPSTASIFDLFVIDIVRIRLPWSSGARTSFSSSNGSMMTCRSNLKINTSANLKYLLSAIVRENDRSVVSRIGHEPFHKVLCHLRIVSMFIKLEHFSSFATILAIFDGCPNTDVARLAHTDESGHVEGQVFET